MVNIGHGSPMCAPSWTGMVCGKPNTSMSWISVWYRSSVYKAAFCCVEPDMPWLALVMVHPCVLHHERRVARRPGRLTQPANAPVFNRKKEETKKVPRHQCVTEAHLGVQDRTGEVRKSCQCHTKPQSPHDSTGIVTSSLLTENKHGGQALPNRQSNAPPDEARPPRLLWHGCFCKARHGSSEPSPRQNGLGDKLHEKRHTIPWSGHRQNTGSR